MSDTIKAFESDEPLVPLSLGRGLLRKMICWFFGHKNTVEATKIMENEDGLGFYRWFVSTCGRCGLQEADHRWAMSRDSRALRMEYHGN